MSFLHILHVLINKMSVNDVSSHGNELTDLFIKILRYRSAQKVNMLLLTYCITVVTFVGIR